MPIADGQMGIESAPITFVKLPSYSVFPADRGQIISVQAVNVLLGDHDLFQYKFA